MPKLIHCAVCNGMVSDDAIRCPHCNAGHYRPVSSELPAYEREVEEKRQEFRSRRYAPTGIKGIDGYANTVSDLIEVVSTLSVGDKVEYYDERPTPGGYDSSDDIAFHYRIGIITRIEPAKRRLFGRMKLPKVYVKTIDYHDEIDAIYVVNLREPVYRYPRKLIDS